MTGSQKEFLQSNAVKAELLQWLLQGPRVSSSCL